ncbi:MAG TPA: redox-sensing transcriptional repressor Rex, partial [bacterium]|nr:redox-sensing transcriptional repressor Rex [bacterium]
EALVKKQSIEIAVITVPQEEARGVKEKLEEAGIRSILNFAPYYLSLKNGIVRNVELTTELTFLSTHLNLHGRKK